jgi:hypothetical protein
MNMKQIIFLFLLVSSVSWAQLPWERPISVVNRITWNTMSESLVITVSFAAGSFTDYAPVQLLSHEERLFLDLAMNNCATIDSFKVSLPSWMSVTSTRSILGESTVHIQIELDRSIQTRQRIIDSTLLVEIPYNAIHTNSFWSKPVTWIGIVALSILSGGSYWLWSQNHQSHSNRIPNPQIDVP